MWLLQYDGEGHVLHQEKNRIDFTKRMGQFLDYYLRDSLPPVWMTKGANAKEKGKRDYFEYDQEGNIP